MLRFALTGTPIPGRRWLSAPALGGLVLALAMVGCSPAPPAPPTVPPTQAPTSSAPGTTAPTDTTGPVAPDFDGDEGADLVVGIGDNPGQVSVRYANGRALDFGRKDLDSANADSIDFGQALLAADLNGDGFTDLVVSDPNTDLGLTLFWIYGSPTGLDLAGRVVTATAATPGAGRTLALVTQPSLILAVGGGTSGNTGVVLSYQIGDNGSPSPEAEQLTPQSLNLPALPAGSGFGSALAATGGLLAIGAPGAAVGSARQAGAVYTVNYLVEPLRALRITQDSPGVGDNAQIGDSFGAALAAGDGYLVVGVPGEDRLDERGHNQADTGMVQPFRIVGGDLEPEPAVDQNELPGNVEAGDRFGSALSVVRPCRDTSGILVGASAEAIGNDEQAGSVWLVPLGIDPSCGAIQLYDGEGLGPDAAANTLVGSAVSALRVDAEGDTLVIVAQGNSEEGVPGRVLTLDYPYRDAPVTALTDLSIAEEREIAVSSQVD